MKGAKSLFSFPHSSVSTTIGTSEPATKLMQDAQHIKPESAFMEEGKRGNVMKRPQGQGKVMSRLQLRGLRGKGKAQKETDASAPSPSKTTATGSHDQDKSTHVRCETTKGTILVKLLRHISPLGVRRYTELVESGFFQNIAFFRVVPKFLTQFGRSVGHNKYDEMRIKDDHPPQSERKVTRGTLCYAGAGGDSRTNQLFFAFCKDCGGLGKAPWETPVGQIEGAESMKVLAAIEQSGYGDMPPWGKGPAPDRIESDSLGTYLKEFPKLAYYKGCELVSLPP